MLPPEMNTTDLARKARIRMEQTRKDIIETNNRISQLIGETFGGGRKEERRQQDEDQRNGDQQNRERVSQGNI
jgi:hypothetical protein